MHSPATRAASQGISPPSWGSTRQSPGTSSLESTHSSSSGKQGPQYSLKGTPPLPPPAFVSPLASLPPPASLPHSASHLPQPPSLPPPASHLPQPASLPPKPPFHPQLLASPSLPSTPASHLPQPPSLPHLSLPPASHLPQAGTRTPVQTAGPCPSESGFAVGRGTSREWVGGGLLGHRLPCPIRLTPHTFLVLCIDTQRETMEMRKMHRAYQ